MSQIKKLIDKIVVAEGRNAREIILLLQDAKELRDEVMKVMLDKQTRPEEVIEVVMKGGKFK
jgi:hypothetical protein